MKRLLIVEDEIDLQNALVMGLSSLGHQVDGASDGTQALDLYYNHQYDLVVLDLNIPFVDGTELLKNFREENPQLNIIILSARSEVEDKVKGINLGANDYLTKPFNFDELVARVNGLLRREFLQYNESIDFGDYCLDTTEKKLFYQEKQIHVSKKEYEILYLLFTNQNRCVESLEMMDYLWEEQDGSTEKLKVLINKLRKKLPINIIKNKWGVGYYVAKS